MARHVTLISNNHLNLNRVIIPNASKDLSKAKTITSPYLKAISKIPVTKLLRIQATPENLKKVKLCMERTRTLTFNNFQILVHNCLQIMAYLSPNDYEAWKELEYLNHHINDTIEVCCPPIDAEEEQALDDLVLLRKDISIRTNILLAHYWDVNEFLEKMWDIPSSSR